eukprot:11904611-Karenia_brevis.AAC.1
MVGLRRKRINVRAVVKQGFAASLAYGASCTGTPTPIRRFLKEKLAATRRGAGLFRSATLAE